MAFPTKVKVLKAPDVASSEGTELVLTTNKGTVTVSSQQAAYQQLLSVRKGQCLILESESESDIEFNQKLNRSGLSSIKKTNC